MFKELCDVIYTSLHYTPSSYISIFHLLLGHKNGNVYKLQLWAQVIIYATLQGLNTIAEFASFLPKPERECHAHASNLHEVLFTVTANSFGVEHNLATLVLMHCRHWNKSFHD